MSTPLTITVSPGGKTRFIYNDRLRGLLAEGDAKIERASHVEPGDPAKGQDPTLWYADMAPSGGPVLGPFRHRQDALDEEVAWLNRNVLRAVC